MAIQEDDNSETVVESYKAEVRIVLVVALARGASDVGQKVHKVQMKVAYMVVRHREIGRSPSPVLA